MLIVSHRGNLEGPDPSRENTLEAVEECLRLGFGVEVDLNSCDGGWRLGHNEPLRDMNWVNLNQIDLSGVFIHLKFPGVVVPDLVLADLFAIEEDSFVLTMRGRIWSRYRVNFVGSKTIVCAPELDDCEDSLEGFVKICLKQGAYGICTDYPLEVQRLRKFLYSRLASVLL